MRCHHINDSISGSIFIAGCMGGAVHGIENCHCQEKNDREIIRSEYKEEILRLRSQVKRLKLSNQSIKKKYKIGLYPIKKDCKHRQKFK